MKIVKELPSKYKLGHEILDTQHAQIIGVLDEIISLVKSKKLDKKEIDEILNYLNNYSRVHLTYEENKMLKSNYSNIEHHFGEHKKFRNYLLDINSNGQIENISELNRLSLFLKDWFLKHIMVVDMEFANFLRSLENEKEEFIKKKQLNKKKL